MSKPHLIDASDTLMTRKEVLAFFGGIHVSTLNRGIRQGRFPKPYRMGPRTPRWSLRECEAALELLREESPS